MVPEKRGLDAGEVEGEVPASRPILMFVVNACRRDRAASAAPAGFRGAWLLRSAGGRAAETTVSRL